MGYGKVGVSKERMCSYKHTHNGAVQQALIIKLNLNILVEALLDFKFILIMYKRAILVIICFSFFSCYLNDFSKGVKEDSIKMFYENKKYLYTCNFEGVVVSKKKCADCKIYEYSLKIELHKFNPDKMDRGTHFYRFTEEERYLEIKVCEDLYKYVNVMDILKKKENNRSLEVLNNNGSSEYLWLDEGKSWLANCQG